MTEQLSLLSEADWQEHKKALNRARQRRYRERQRLLHKRKQYILLLTSEEAFYLDRVLQDMREHGRVPAMSRDKKGRVHHIDT